MIEYLRKLFISKPELTLEEIWLSQSGTLEEVERRQRMIQRGQAPWQTSRMY